MHAPVARATRRTPTSELRELALEQVGRFPESVQTSVVALNPGKFELGHEPGSDLLGKIRPPCRLPTAIRTAGDLTSVNLPATQ